MKIDINKKYRARNGCTTVKMEPDHFFTTTVACVTYSDGTKINVNIEDTTNYDFMGVDLGPNPYGGYELIEEIKDMDKETCTEDDINKLSKKIRLNHMDKMLFEMEERLEKLEQTVKAVQEKQPDLGRAYL